MYLNGITCSCSSQVLLCCNGLHQFGYRLWLICLSKLTPSVTWQHGISRTRTTESVDVLPVFRHVQFQGGFVVLKSKQLLVECESSKYNRRHHINKNSWTKQEHFESSNNFVTVVEFYLVERSSTFQTMVVLSLLLLTEHVTAWQLGRCIHPSQHSLPSSILQNQCECILVALPPR